MKVVGDLEANGLLHPIDGSDPATIIWCGVFKDIETKEVHRFYPDDIENLHKFLDNVELLIGHNFCAYDIPLMKCILDYTFKGEVFDTYIVSQLTEPDRVGGHGLEPWGKRFKRYKPEHDDWSQFSDDMMHRCEEDVEINYLVYKQLLKELGV